MGSFEHTNLQTTFHMHTRLECVFFKQASSNSMLELVSINIAAGCVDSVWALD